MARFAEVDDLEARWRPLTPDEASRAAVLLDDASQLVIDECPKAEAGASAATLERIVCAMVKRALVGGSEAAGVQTAQVTAGPFSQSQTYVNPTGDLYLTKAERRVLPCGQGRAFSIDLSPLSYGTTDVPGG